MFSKRGLGCWLTLRALELSSFLPVLGPFPLRDFLVPRLIHPRNGENSITLGCREDLMNLGPSPGYVSYGGEILGPQCVYPPLPRSPTWGVSAIVCS